MIEISKACYKSEINEDGSETITLTLTFSGFESVEHMRRVYELALKELASMKQ